MELVYAITCAVFIIGAMLKKRPEKKGNIEPISRWLR